MILNGFVNGLKSRWNRFVMTLRQLRTKFGLGGCRERLKRLVSFWKRNETPETSSEK